MVWHTVPKVVPLLFPRRIWSGAKFGKQVYLTFDDGPVRGVTDFVLEELAKRSQKATFFMVGDNLRKNPELGKAVLEEGHLIGNHTYNHLNGWKTADEEYLKNIQTFDQELNNVLGISTDLFRPPYGLIKFSQAKSVLKTKKLIMWNVLSGDYVRRIDPSRVLSKSISNTRPGSIVLFHDQQKTKEMIRSVLPDYLDFLIDNGFQAKLLGE